MTSAPRLSAAPSVALSRLKQPKWYNHSTQTGVDRHVRTRQTTSDSLVSNANRPRAAQAAQPAQRLTRGHSDVSVSGALRNHGGRGAVWSAPLAPGGRHPADLSSRHDELLHD